MSFCPQNKCHWYGEAKPGYRKCYYGEPACWKGWLDAILAAVKFRFKGEVMNNDERTVGVQYDKTQKGKMQLEEIELENERKIQENDDWTAHIRDLYALSVHKKIRPPLGMLWLKCPLCNHKVKSRNEWDRLVWRQYCFCTVCDYEYVAW